MPALRGFNPAGEGARRTDLPPVDYAKLLRDIQRLGNYHILPRNLIHAAGHAGADFLMHLAHVGKVKADAEGFVKYGVGYCERGICVTPRHQEGILASMSGHVDVRVIDGVRYVRADPDYLLDLCKGGHFTR